MKFDKTVPLLENALKLSLPGEEVQYRLAPDTRLSKNEYLEKFKEHRSSSVLILLYPDSQNSINTVLIKRTANGGVHSSQIAFPGGKKEKTDISLWHTAIRESEEEIGIDSGDIRNLGELSSLFIPVSKFLVHPFVGALDYTPSFTANEIEVNQIISSPISELRKMNIQNQEVSTSYGNIMVPLYELNEFRIWGATAMIISEFLEIINSRID